MSSHGDIAIEMKNVSKEFPGTLAVDGVHFTVCSGEVHALVGENGAGKSTLMKIMAGSFHDYSGEIYIRGEEVRLHNPSIAIDKGIGMIYQELSLAKPISIAENILVGRLPVKRGFILDRGAMLREASKLLQRVGLEDLHPFTLVEEISQHKAQLVEIAKVLGKNPDILVMDEPTSALSREEVELLFKIIVRLKEQGLAIVYISHHLPEIFRVADRVTVMRDAKKITTVDIKDVTAEEVAQLMVGRTIDEFYSQKKEYREEERLTVKNVSRYGFFHHISFHACRGEILGIAGLAGSGRTEICRSICGIDPLNEGEIFLDGELVNPRSLTEALEQGIGYLTEDRKNEGLFLRLIMKENLMATLIPQHCTMSIYHKEKSRGLTETMIEDLDISPPSPDLQVSSFSGGNQQKILLAKWLATNPKVLFLDEPTRGVDVGAKKIIHRAIMELANRGTTIILISSDLPELVGLSHHILVMRKGHSLGWMKKDGITEETVLLAMNGEGDVLYERR